MKSFVIVRLLFLFAVLGLGTVTVRAQNLDAIKARMEQRIGSINAIKDRGAAGENNRGFLEARGGASADDQRIISEENSDRRAVYAAIAAQTGSSADAVGSKRAQQIAAIARSGHWIQDTGGTWKQKG